MRFKLPPPAWQRLEDVCHQWKATRADVLKFAADGQLQLHAFVKPYSTTFFRLEGRSVAWIATTPVVILQEIADRLIHESYVDVDDWETKEGVRWEYGLSGNFARQLLRISGADLVIFTDERQRFEAKHATVEEPVESTEVHAVGLPDAERDKLLRQIGALALAVAAKGGKYTKGGRPNVSQITKAVLEVIDALEDKNAAGVGDSSLRTSIGKGLDLLNG